MFSVIIPAGNNLSALKQTLQSIGKAKSTGHEIIIVGGEDIVPEKLAADYNATLVIASTIRGEQKNHGAVVAKEPWLLFLHPGTWLQKDWLKEAQRFSQDEKNISNAGVFRCHIDDAAALARRLESIIAWGSQWVGTSGAQGLLIHRDLYASLGGFKPYPQFEDIDLTRNIVKRKGSKLLVLDTDADIDAAYYRKHGYILGGIWKLTGLYFYLLGIPPAWATKMLGE